MKRMPLLLLVALFLSGCWDVDEPERMFYIFGLGVDYKDGKYIMHAQIIDFSNIAKSEQPANPDAIQAEVGTSSGVTPSEAFYQLYQAIDEQLFWGHFSYLVFSEDALKEGRANLLINTFSRYHETRYNTWVYSTRQDVKELMLTTPIVNRAISLSKLSDPLNSFSQDSFIQPVNLRRLIIDFNEPGHEVRIPLTSVFDKWETTKNEDTSVKIHGVSVVSPNELKGFIQDDSAQGLQWMAAQTERSSLTYKGDTDDETMSVILDHIKPEVTPVINGNDIHFKIKISLQATISGFTGTKTVDDIEKAVVKQVEEEVRTTFEEGLAIDADIYRLSEIVYRKHFKAWKSVEKDGKIPLSKDSIREIEINVEKVGSGRKKFIDTVE